MELSSDVPSLRDMRAAVELSQPLRLFGREYAPARHASAPITCPRAGSLDPMFATNQATAIVEAAPRREGDRMKAHLLLLDRFGQEVEQRELDLPDAWAPLLGPSTRLRLQPVAGPDPESDALVVQLTNVLLCPDVDWPYLALMGTVVA